jgi:hypothetical protein
LLVLAQALEAAAVPPPKPLGQPNKTAGLQRQLAALSRQIDSLFELHGRGILTTDDFERRYQELAQQRTALTQQEDHESAADVLAQAQRLIRIEEPTQETLRQLILLLVARVDCPDSGERAARLAEGRTEAAARAPRRELTIHPRPNLFTWQTARLELRTLAFKGKREIHWQ